MQKNEIRKEYDILQNITDFQNHSEKYSMKIKELSDKEKSLLNNIDMILFYVWDLARISKNDDIRDEYISYSFDLFEIMNSKNCNSETISNYLISIEENIILYPELDELTRNTFSLFLCSLKDIS